MSWRILRAIDLAQVTYRPADVTFLNGLDNGIATAGIPDRGFG